KIEDYKSQVGFSERTDAAIEPKLSMQWFCKMDELAKPALEYVENGTIKLIPEKFFASYKHWMENVKDWCISRQLWWGQRIPAWYNENRSEEHTSELQSRENLVCRLLLEKKKRTELTR